MTKMMNENMILAQRPDYKTEIAEILRSSLTPKRMQERLQDYHENDIAAALELVGKEARVGLVNGLILGALSVVSIGLYLFALKGQSAVMAFSVSLCIGATLLLSILLSSICGTVIPLIFKKLNVDPAVASGPLITTINDLVAVVSYYGLAWVLLIQILHL